MAAHPACADALREPARLAVLQDLDLLGAPAEEAFDRFTRLAGGLIGAPQAMISLLDGNDQYFMSTFGVPEPMATLRQTPIGDSTCQHVVASRAPMVVDDLRESELLRDSAAIPLGMIAYAGMPIHGDGEVLGTLCLTDSVPRAWTEQDVALLADLAAAVSTEIALRLALRKAAEANANLHDEATHDALTGLPNRRQLARHLDAACAPDAAESTFALFDLDGFKAYNDTFGHPAGDALLARLGARLAQAVEGHGSAHRIGGDEFCILIDGSGKAHDAALLAARQALSETGKGFRIDASQGTARLPTETSEPTEALRLVDERMYAAKHRGRLSARAQTAQALLRAVSETDWDLAEHVDDVAGLAVLVAKRLGLAPSVIDDILLTAQLHDVGKMAIPDAILDKPGALTPEEWGVMRQHTLIGERILAAAPALSHVSRLVRSSHERPDGAGYPDRLKGEDIPIESRIVSVCGAYHAMLGERPYRPAMTVAEALQELRDNAGTQFDARVVDILVALIGERPARKRTNQAVTTR